MRFLVVLIIAVCNLAYGQVIIDFQNAENLSNVNIYCHSPQKSLTEKYSCNLEGQLVLSNNWEIGDSLHLRFNNYEGLKLDTLIKLKAINQFELRRVIDFEETQIFANAEEIPLNKAKNSLTVIDKEFIEKTGSQTLTDVLESQPNISIANDPVLGQSIRLAGQSGENVQILIDGVPVIGRLNGNIDPSQILMNNVEKIEIFIGDLSDIYGNNAQAGTINLITTNKDEKRVSAQLGTYYETSGNYNLDLYTHYSFKKQRLSIALGRNYFDGWSSSDDFTFLPKSKLANENRVQTWKPKEALFANVSWSIKGKSYKNTFKLNAFQDEILNRGLPIKPYHLKAIDERYFTSRFGGSNQNIIRLKKGYIQNLISYNFYQRRKHSYLKDLNLLQSNLLPDGENSDTQDTSSIHAQMLRSIYHVNWDFFKLKTGIHQNFERYLGNRIVDGDKYILSASAFVNAQYEIRKSNTTLMGSLRYGYNSSFKTKPLPKVSIAQALAKNRLNFIFTYSQGFRAPNVKELYFDFVDINHNIQGNPNLESESANNLQALIKAKLDKKSRVTIDASYRHNVIYKQIILALLENTNTYTYINSDQSIVNSSSFMLNYTGKKWSARIGGSYTRSILSGELSEEINNADIAGSFNYNFSKHNWGIVSRANYVFQQDNLLISETDFQVSKLSPYLNADIALNKHFFKKQLMVNVGVNNIFNNTQRQVLGNTANSGGAHNSSSNSLNLATGRQVFVSIIYKFSKP